MGRDSIAAYRTPRNELQHPDINPIAIRNMAAHDVLTMPYNDAGNPFDGWRQKHGRQRFPRIGHRLGRTA